MAAGTVLNQLAMDVAEGYGMDREHIEFPEVEHLRVVIVANEVRLYTAPWGLLSRPGRFDDNSHRAFQVTSTLRQREEEECNWSHGEPRRTHPRVLCCSTRT